MDDLLPDFQLHSIDRLRSSRRKHGDDEHKGHAEAKSWADAPTRTHAEPTPYVPAGDPDRRLAYEVLTSDARRFAVTLTCEPVFDLRRGATSLDYLREHRRQVARTDEAARVRTLWPTPQHKEDRDLLDGLKFKRGLALLEGNGPGHGIMPTSWREVTESRLAFSALNQCLRARLDPHTRLIGELTDIPAGASRAEVREVAAYLADRRRGVIARLPPDAEALDVVAEAGFKGVSYSLASQVLASFALPWSRLEALITATRKIATFVLADQAKPEFGDKLREAGATHAVFTRFGGRVI